MSKIIDVTVPLSAEAPTYPGDPPFQRELTHRMDAGQPHDSSRLTLGSHAGTHVDAPSHFVPGGLSVDELPLELLTGKVRVIQVSSRTAVERQELEELDLRDDLRLFIKTRNSGQLRQPAFQEDYVHLGADAATYLMQVGIKLVGIDALSVDAYPSREFPAHRTLLSAGVIIVEGLDLSQVDAGEYDLFCFPLRITGGDGAPARVVLRSRP